MFVLTLGVTLPVFIVTHLRPAPLPTGLPVTPFVWGVHLAQSCWAEDPTKRPSFAKVGDLLQGMLQDGIDQNWYDTNE